MPKTEKEENAIVAANMEVNGRGLSLRNFQDMKLAAETFLTSDLVPTHFNTVGKVIVALQAGAELGFMPWQSLQNLHVVNGKVGIASSAIGGLIRNSGKVASMEQVYDGQEGDDEYKAIVTSQRKDDIAVHHSEFSVADAKTAGLWGKGAWKGYPKDMLMWRALSRHGRMFYGDVLSGFYTDEELAAVKPDPAYETTAPRREDRKQVEKIEPGNEILQEQITEVFKAYVAKTLLIRPTHDELTDAFADLCAAACGGETSDYCHFDDDMNKVLKESGFDVNKLTVINQAINEMPDPAPAEEETAAPVKYKCKRCERTFAEKTEKGLCGCLGELEEVA